MNKTTCKMLKNALTGNQDSDFQICDLTHTNTCNMSQYLENIIWVTTWTKKKGFNEYQKEAN